MNPTVSIILPVYNGMPYLRAAIKSVLEQTCRDFEFLIINDCSTDSSKEVIAEFTDPRIRIIEHSSNQGLIASLNEGLREARGAYIARIDADDAWTHKEKLAKQIEFLSTHPEYALVGTQAEMVNENDILLFPSDLPTTDQEIRNRILINNCFIHPSVVFVKQVALDAGGFRDGEKYMEDYSLWIRMGEKALFANLPESLMDYRIHTKGESQKNNLEQIKNSLAMISLHKKTYPHFYTAWFKWNLKRAIITLIPPDVFLKIKRWYR